jgi:hypothetical protein
MNRRRSLPIILLLLALVSSVLGCALPASTTPVPDAASIELTVQAVLAAQGTTLPPADVPLADAAPTGLPPSLEPSLTPTLTPTFTPTPTQTPVPLPCDAAQFVTDVTIGDDSSITTNAEFTKTWRLRNAGTCTWTSGYQVVFDHGDRMSAPDAVMVTSGTVPPGSTVDVSVVLKAPGTAGTYQGYFKLRNPSGVLFGIGADANTAFWVKIKAEGFLFLMITPMILMPITPIISSSGTGMDLLKGGCFDLDNGAGIGCGNGGADFEYEYEIFTQDQIDPRNSATFGSHFNSEPTYSQCRDSSYGSGTFDPAQNRWYCTLTTDGNYGWIKIRDTGMMSLEFDWTTW